MILCTMRFFRDINLKRNRFFILRVVTFLFVVYLLTTLRTRRVLEESFGGLVFEDTLHVNEPSYLCLLQPQTLRGKRAVTFETNLTETILQNPEVTAGGEWRPRDCIARRRVAVVIPYRDRAEHLAVQLANLHPMLQRQKLHYRIFVVEQLGTDEFNKGALMNTAFTVANETMAMDCLVFHDVDLVPMDDRNHYGCFDKPHHLSVSIDSFDYALPYATLVGGVLGMSTRVFLQVNGYSNMYWGWGAEDDYMYDRFVKHNITLVRPNASIAIYHKIQHSNERRHNFGYNARIRLYNEQHLRDRSSTDGISSLSTQVIAVRNCTLYTHITVNVGEHPMQRPLNFNINVGSFLLKLFRFATGT